MAGAGATRQNAIVIILMSVVLIAGLVTAIIIPAGEFPPRGYAIFNLCLDALMTVILGVLVMADRQAAPSGTRSIVLLLGVFGVLAGVAQIAIRFTSDHAWWTGQYLPPVFN